MIAGLAYVLISVASGIFFTAFLIRKDGMRDDDWWDRWIFAAMGLFAGFLWPMVIPVTLVMLAAKPFTRDPEPPVRDWRSTAPLDGHHG